MRQWAPAESSGSTCSSLNPGPGFISSWDSPWIFSVTWVFIAWATIHIQPTCAGWEMVHLDPHTGCLLPRRSSRVTTSRPSCPPHHTWCLTTCRDVVSTRHGESFSYSSVESARLMFLLLKKWFKSCRGQTGSLRFNQHVVGVVHQLMEHRHVRLEPWRRTDADTRLKGARRKENIDLFPHPGDDKSAQTSDDLSL